MTLPVTLRRKSKAAFSWSKATVATPAIVEGAADSLGLAVSDQLWTSRPGAKSLWLLPQSVATASSARMATMDVTNDLVLVVDV